MTEKDLERILLDIELIKGVKLIDYGGLGVDHIQTLAQAILTYIRKEQVKLLEDVLKVVNKKKEYWGHSRHHIMSEINRIKEK